MGWKKNSLEPRLIMKSRIIAALLSVSAALFLGGCGDKSSDTARIATKPMTEQFILGEMLKILIEKNTLLKVDITKGVGGGTSNIHPALLKGEFDMYPEYTGTGWSFVLKKQGVPDDETLLAELTRDYEQKFDLEWVGLYGFNNTFGLVVRKELAEKHDIRTFSDLALHSGPYVFGAEYDFYEREDGYDSLRAAYGFDFAKHIDLDIGLKYLAIKNKQIDVMTVFTTDGQLSSSDIRLLKDDKRFYQTYYCGTVARGDILKKHPELRSVLMKMNGLVNEEEMARMNHAVEKEGRNEHDVAMEFLRSKGLVS